MLVVATGVVGKHKWIIMVWVRVERVGSSFVSSANISCLVITRDIVKCSKKRKCSWWILGEEGTL